MSKESAALKSGSQDRPAGEDVQVGETPAKSPSSDTLPRTEFPSSTAHARIAGSETASPAPTNNSTTSQSATTRNMVETAGQQTVRVQRLGTQTRTSRGAGIGDHFDRLKSEGMRKIGFVPG
jgi:hypothetical protein